MLLTKLFLLPLFLHVVLILFVGMRSLRARYKAVRSGQTKLHEIATDSNAWPSRVKKFSNNFDNQFQVPMLWYALCALVVALKFEDYAFAALSWIFILSRLAHSFVHTTSNDVPVRMRVFLFGFFVLLVMWLWFGFKLFVMA